MNRPAVRLLLAGLGLGGIAWGAWLVLGGGRATDLRSVVLWAALALVAHDGVLAPVVVGAGWLAARRLPGGVRAPVQVGALVAASLTLVSAPLWLGRLVRGPSVANPSADPLDYPRNLVLVLLAVAAATAVAVTVGLVASRRQRRSATN
ncbi:hypothetical protein GCM10027446_00730 [Angustibacter peucedani]